MKILDIMKLKEARGQMAGQWAYLFYGDAKEASIKTGDEFCLSLTMPDGRVDVLKEDVYRAEEYITFREDINRSFKGFRCTKIN